MHIVVVVPGSANLDSAGVRIRYSRLTACLAAAGHELNVCLVDSLSKREKWSGDVYLISKCYDARSLLLAEALRRQGRLVGVDIFDDYFSQVHDSRLVHMRRWLHDISACADFVTVASPQMVGRLHDLGIGVPVHLVQDPFEDWNCDAVAKHSQERLQIACAERRIDVCWFGMGDNQYFNVGLDDLFSHSDALAYLRRTGFDVRLSILTNMRALTADRMAMLARLPIRADVLEWSLADEHDCLSRSLLAFLPVNAQPFSTAKSHNRAVTALTHGVQVLSQGYPLYSDFAEFIYDQPAQFLIDLGNGRMRLGPQSIKRLDPLLREIADPRVQAQRLVGFLSGLKADKARSNSAGTNAVLHGAETNPNVEKFARSLGALSIASPFSPRKVGVDIALAEEENTGRCFLQLSKNAVAALNQAARREVTDWVISPGKQVQGVSLPPTIRIMRPDAVSYADLSLYAPMMREYIAILRKLIPLNQLFLSETMSLRWISTEDGAGDTNLFRYAEDAS